MLSSTTSTIPGCVILEAKGLVRGIAVRGPKFLWPNRTLEAGHCSPLAGEAAQTRIDAFATMLANAEALGANAVVGIRYDSCATDFNGGMLEVLCYGTAVVVGAPPPDSSPPA